MGNKYIRALKKWNDEFMSHLGLAFIIALVAQLCFHVDQTYCLDILFAVIGLLQLISFVRSVREEAAKENPTKKMENQQIVSLTELIFLNKIL